MPRTFRMLAMVWMPPVVRMSPVVWVPPMRVGVLWPVMVISGVMGRLGRLMIAILLTTRPGGLVSISRITCR